MQIPKQTKTKLANLRPLFKCANIFPHHKSTWATTWRFKKLKVKLSYDSASPLLGIYPEKIKILKDTCTLMLTAALFMTARTWKQPKCPPTNEWMKKIRSIYTMEYYSAIKRNKIGPFIEMDLGFVIQSDISQKEENKYYMLKLIDGI